MNENNCKKIFLNNMNTWFSKYVIENFNNDEKCKYSFMGTCNNSDTKLPKMFLPKIIKINSNYHYDHEIFTNDVFIFNLEDTNYRDIEYVIKGLKTIKHSNIKILIIVSSIMTWARTSPKIKKEKIEDDGQNENDQNDEGKGEEKVEENKEELSEDEEVIEEEEPVEEGKEENKEEGEEQIEKDPPKKFAVFKDRDYILRVPSKKFYPYKMIETLALSASSTNQMLKSYIICPGLIYGCEETTFYDYFKYAWLNNPEKLPILTNDQFNAKNAGKNSIPTIHIFDLVNLIRRMVYKIPNNKYVFAVDRTKNRSLKKIITAISKSVGNGDIEFCDDKNMIPSYEELSIDIRVKTSKVFDDIKGDEEEEEEFIKRCFKWHCEFGIEPNGEILRKEFTESRNMKPLKIIFSGPPVSGKTYLSEKLAKIYNLPHYKITDIVAYGLTLTDELGEEIKAKFEEIKEKIREELEAEKETKKKKSEVDTIPRLPDEIIYKILKRMLKENICRNRGYILDGYPRNYANAEGIFTEIDENKPEDDPDRIRVIDEIMPNRIINLDNYSVEFLNERAKSMNMINTHYNEEGMKRRIKSFQIMNESPIGELNICDYFVRKKIDFMKIDCKLDEDSLILQIKTFLEKYGVINNYQVLEKLENKKYISKFENSLNTNKNNEDNEKLENEFFENQKTDIKEQFNKEKLDALKDVERTTIEDKSQDLRSYLLDNVIPLLSQGILEICQKLPEDPVDYLAEFLFERSISK